MSLPLATFPHSFYDMRYDCYNLAFTDLMKNLYHDEKDFARALLSYDDPIYAGMRLILDLGLLER